MLTEILIGILAAIFLGFSYKFAFLRPTGYPPGPPRIPIFGSYLFLLLANYKWLHKGALLLSKIYKSDIISLYLGKYVVYVVNSAEGVKTVLRNSDFDGRADIFLARMRDPMYNRKGIFFLDGPVWKAQRRFILRYMRDFGFGRRFEELELVIKEEISDFVDLIKNGPRFEHEKEIARPGGQILLPLAFSPFATNPLFHIMYNERYARIDQEKILSLAKAGMVLQRLGDDYGKLLSIIPWIRFIFPNWSSFKPLEKANKHLHKFFADIIDRHEETYDEEHERNFIDLYLKQMAIANAENNTNTTFLRDQFILSLVDFSFPAMTAIGTQISLLMQYFLLHPKLFTRIQAEIDEVVGSGRLPSLDDRKNMHFTEATIREGLRIETLVPSDIPHVAMVDTELMGFSVAQGTIVIPSLFAFHNDPRVWGDPQKFRPERFLDADGKLSLNKDISLPFGAGKRLCAGETYARNMLFLMVSAICQNFNILLEPGQALPDLSKNLSGLIISPPDFWLTLQPRD